MGMWKGEPKIHFNLTKSINTFKIRRKYNEN